MSVKLKFFLYGVEVIPEVPETDLVPRKGDHLLWNGVLLEVIMVVWRHDSAVNLYLMRDPLQNPLPAGLDEIQPQPLIPTNL